MGASYLRRRHHMAPCRFTVHQNPKYTNTPLFQSSPMLLRSSTADLEGWTEVLVKPVIELPSAPSNPPFSFISLISFISLND